MIGFKEWLEWRVNEEYDAEENHASTHNHDGKQFASLPWNWLAMQQAKIVNPLYYYAKGAYVNGQPEDLEDFQFSVISLPNLHGIPHNELSVKNRKTGYVPSSQEFVNYLKKYSSGFEDGKINQIYNGIKMVGKKPEDFGGKDIRQSTTTNQPRLG